MRNLWRSVQRGFGVAWRAVDQARRAVVNVLFLALLVFLIGWLLFDDRPGVPASTALVVGPYGQIVEELTDDTEDRAILAVLGERQPETLLRSLVEAIEAATDDERVKALVIDTDRMGGAGLSKLQTLRASIERFKETGKPVIATADYYSQAQYYLAATADEVYMHPMGIVFIPGYGSYRNYYKEALDKLEADWHVFRVGEYKSAVEPYLRSDMSPAARESRERWLGLLWQAYREDVERSRGLETGTLDRYANRFPDLLAEQGGDSGAVAEAIGLVDRLAHRDEVRERLIELVGTDDDGESYSRIDHSTYLAAVGEDDKRGRDRVAVVVARGGIYDGRRAPGSVGGDSMAQLIRKVREDDSVRALVLRVDSPGGSAFASEIIRREVVLTTEAGKPVVVSMSSVAASGGYWISMSADEIWAQPTTITGSIGIYAMFPTFPRTLGRFGIRNDGVGTGALAGTLRPERPLPAEAERAMELMIDEGYREFIEGVAEGRGKALEEVDSIARGRVWAGSDAFELGLVDHLGGLDQAIESAARRVDLGDDYDVVYYQQKRDWRNRILDRIVEAVAGKLARIVGRAPARDPELRILDDLMEELLPLSEFGDPNGFYAYCFCEPN